MIPAESDKKNVLIVGCGKIGLRLANRLSQTCQVWGLRRSSMEHESIKFIQADVCRPETLEQNIPKKIDYVIYCLTPSEPSEKGYRDIYVEGLKNILNALEACESIQRFFFISSTSVYHQDDSSIVDESSPTQPKRFSGQTLLEAEQLIAAHDIPETVIRFSGIYGGNRSRLIDLVRNAKAKLSEELRLTNRIHEDDCVGFLEYLIKQDQKGLPIAPCYIATDSAPVDYNTVIQFIADKLGVTILDKDPSPKRRAGNKRCSNLAMLATGYTLLFPSFKEGYTQMLNHLETSSQK